MWWGHYSHRGRGGNPFWIIILIIIGFTLISGRGGNGNWWLIFPLFFFVIPVISRIAGSMFSESEKRKNDAYEDEKPKREARPPQYIMSEDGEPLEVIEEDVPRRKQKPDDIEYV